MILSARFPAMKPAVGSQFVALTAWLMLALASPAAWAQTSSPTTREPAAQPSTSFPAAIRPATISEDSAGHIYAEIETSKGMIEADLDFQRVPLTTLNFVGLAEGTLPFQNRPAGKPFYDGLTFHRVVKDFVIQGGDPLSADPAVPAEKLGDGGPGYSFPDEFSPGVRHDAAGVLSMVNDGPDTNGSQFFITLREVNRLNYLHSVFGQVVRGLDVVNRIEPGDKILHVTIRRVGQAAETFHADEQTFQAQKARTLEKRQPTPTGFVYLEDSTKQLPDFRVKNFNFKLANYERMTGHRVAVRLLPGEGTNPTAQSAGASAKNVALSLGLPDAGDNVLLCYFAGQNTWTSRLGEKTYPALIGDTGTTDQLMANGVLHEKKIALLAAAQAQTKEGKLKEAVDAGIDTVILTMDNFALKQTDPK